MPLQMVTANRLADGAVVFLGGDGQWCERCEDGRIATDAAEAQALLAAAERDVAACVVVAPYLIEVAIDGGPPRPLRLREQIRALGPTVRPDLGKQAERP